MKKLNVSIISGADGPTSIFIAGKNEKMGVIERVKKICYEKKKARIEATITADSHTLEEVVEYLRSSYGAIEKNKESHEYIEQYKSLRQALIIKNNPELLEDMQEIKKPYHYDEDSLKEFWKQIEEREKRAEAIAEDAFPTDFHLFDITIPDIGEIQCAVERNWNVFACSYSCNKKEMKKLGKIVKDIYLYYGVTDEDILKKSERYSTLITSLCS